jgi:hypothetical protein
MHVEPDDELYRVEAVYLGPQGLLLWRARYSAYALFLAIALLAGMVEGLLGITRLVGIVALPIALAVGVLSARLIGKKVSYERPLTAVVVLFWADLAAPRRQSLTSSPRLKAGDSNSQSYAAERGAS